MNIYKLTREKLPANWYEYHTLIVVAEDEDSAKIMPPENDDEDISDWVSPEYVTVELLGTANDSIPKGVILAAYDGV